MCPNSHLCMSICPLPTFNFLAPQSTEWTNSPRHMPCGRKVTLTPDLWLYFYSYSFTLLLSLSLSFTWAVSMYTNLPSANFRRPVTFTWLHCLLFLLLFLLLLLFCTPKVPKCWVKYLPYLRPFVRESFVLKFSSLYYSSIASIAVAIFVIYFALCQIHTHLLSSAFWCRFLHSSYFLYWFNLSPSIAKVAIVKVALSK